MISVAVFKIELDQCIRQILFLCETEFSQSIGMKHPFSACVGSPRVHPIVQAVRADAIMFGMGKHFDRRIVNAGDADIELLQACLNRLDDGVMTAQL